MDGAPYCQLFIASDEQRKEYAIPTLTSRIENDIDLDVSRIENPDRAVNHPRLQEICRDNLEAYKHLPNLT